MRAAAPRPLPQTTASQTSPSSAPSKPVSHKKKHHAKREPTQKAPTADRVTEIQSALARGGYYQGDPNGKWDSNTVAAMQKFQSANGLNSSGKIDATTLQKLGLGSSTAGVDAPKPVKKSDSTGSANAALHPPSATSSTSAVNANSASNLTPNPAATPAPTDAKPQH